MLSFGEKIVKIGPANPEIIVSREIIKKRRKKKEINSSKIYSPVSNLAEWVKLPQSIYSNHLLQV